MFLFFSIDNLTATAVHRVDLSTLPEADRKGNKALHNEWAKASSTRDAFVSLVAGLNPTARVHALDNPPAYLHGIVADYDTPLSPEVRQRRLNKMGFKPTFISESYSGGTRAIWLFEQPVPLLDDGEYNRVLLSQAKRELGLGNAFGTLDENCFYRLSQYQHRGWNFRPAGGEPVPEEQTLLWQSKAMKKANWSRVGVELPLEKVEEEIRRRWPNALSEPLHIGCRTRRFWSSEAKNPSSCVCTARGFVCYSGHTPFMSWENLLGKAFCTKAVSTGEGRALEEGYYVQNQFWFKLPMTGSDGVVRDNWVALNRQNAESLLVSRFGLSKQAPESGEDSPVKSVIGDLISLKALCGVIPVLYHPKRVVEVNGKPFLNISTVQALAPASEGGYSWGDGFPWLAEFLSRLFGEEQLDYFLSWLARTYQGALKHAPVRGQAVFIAGAPGCGKTFLSAQVLAPLLGGRSEGTDFLTGVSRFNKHILSSGLIYVDDATMLADYKAHAYYTAMVKRMCANTDFLYEAKHEDATKIPWLGRLVVTLNVDSQSLGVIPATDQSNRDKLCFFRVSDEPLIDPDPEAHARKELPAFAAFLSRYEIPPHCIGSPRFGVKSWLHPELLAESVASGVSGVFSDLFDAFLDAYFEGPQSDILELRGNALKILQLMNMTEGIRDMMHGIATPRSIGSRLGQLLANEDYPLHMRRIATGREWWINRDEYYAYLTERDLRGECSLCPSDLFETKEDT